MSFKAHASGFLPVKAKKGMSAFAEVWSLKNPDLTSKMPLHFNWLMLFSGTFRNTSINFIWLTVTLAHLKICTNHLWVIHCNFFALGFLYPASYHHTTTFREKKCEGMKASDNIWIFSAKCKICPAMAGSAFRGITPSGTMKTRKSCFILKKPDMSCITTLSFCHCFTALQVSLFEQNVANTPTECLRGSCSTTNWVNPGLMEDAGYEILHLEEVTTDTKQHRLHYASLKTPLSPEQ